MARTDAPSELDGLPWPVATLSPEDRVLARNAAFARLHPEVASLADVHPEDRLGLARALENVRSGAGARDVQARLRSGGAEHEWMSLRLSIAAVEGDPGVTLLLVRGPGVPLAHPLGASPGDEPGDRLVMDIFRHVPTACMIFSVEDLAIRAVNDAAVALYGWSREDMLRLAITDIRPREETGLIRSVIRTAADDVWRNTAPHRHQNRSGEVFEVEVFSIPLPYGGRACRLALIRDLRERQAMERRIAESQALALNILGGMADAFYALDADLRFTLVNPAFERMLDRDGAGLIGRHIWQEFPQARSRLDAAFQRVLQTGRPASLTYFLRRRRLWLNLRVYSGSDGLAVFARDITEQVRLERIARRRTREAEEQRRRLDVLNRGLQLSLAQRQRMLDASYDFVCTLDGEGRFLEVGRRVEAIIGYSPEELIGRDYIELVHPDDRDRTHAAERSLFGSPGTLVIRNRHQHRDGRSIVLEWTATWDGEAGVCYANARDLTAAVEAEERLRRTQRLEAVGKLTGGVAHDFNNLLTVVLGNAEEIMAQTDRPDLRELAETVRDAAERGADLTARLLAFSRQQPLSPELVDVERLLRPTEDLLRRLLGGRVSVELAVQADLPPLSIDRAQLSAALLNLCINADEATPGGGVIRISARRGLIQPEAGSPVEAVELSVSDSGSGMDPATLSRAFEPFFTTKGSSTHSGLGLSMVYGFVAQSGGEVLLRSEPGCGACVTLLLPAAAPGVEAVAAAPVSLAPAAGGERILVVEDDAFVREQVCAQLIKLGYAVRQAGDGPSALETAQLHGPFDLLLTDVVMPGGMNGKALAEQVVARQPSIRVLYTSGYSQDALGLDDLEGRGFRLLRKPYRRRVLAETIRAVLDARPPSD